jgi:CubicO group peptidase (beta-lactamase class C family)
VNSKGRFLVRIIPVLVCLNFLACGSGGGGSSSSNPPGGNPPPATDYSYQVPDSLNDGWTVAHLEDEGFDLNQIESMMSDIRNGVFTNIDSIALVRNERLVLDELIRTQLGQGDNDWGNTDINKHSIYSVTKSVNSALMGIAVDQGIIGSLDEVVYDHFPQYSPFSNWDSRKATTTIKNFLTMRHGLDWDELSVSYSDSSNSLIHAQNTCFDWLRCLLDLPTTHDPGTQFAYSTHVSLTLGAIIEDRSGMQLESFADRYLFEPLGISNYLWGEETPMGRARTGSGLLLTSRDMAKFGQLYLNLGTWHGQQIVPAAWVTESVQAHVTLPANWTSTGYGYQWWLDQISYGSSTIDGYHAVGYGGQYIFVFPDLAFVAVFTGSNYGDSDDPGQAYDLLRQYILPAIN